MWFKDFTDAVTATAAAATAIAAWVGLNAWKKQLHGNTDHDIAWKYLEATLKLRNAINRVVRNAWIHPGEIQSAAEKYYGKEEAEKRSKDNTLPVNRVVYAMRWRELQDAIKELDDALVQAEIWWGKKVVGLDKPLNKCVATLYTNVMNLIEPERGLTADRDVIYYGEGITTKFDEELNSAIEKMENFARGYLREPEEKSRWSFLRRV